MANWASKISKAAAGALQPGEQVVAGMFVQPVGTSSRAVGFAAGGVVGSALASKLRTKDDGSLVSDAGTAASLPDKRKLVIGLTDQRVLVYSFGGLLAGKPKQLITSFDRSALAGVDLQGGKLTNRVTLVFADGSGKAYETPRLNSGADEFVAAAG